MFKNNESRKHFKSHLNTRCLHIGIYYKGFFFRPTYFHQTKIENKWYCDVWGEGGERTPTESCLRVCIMSKYIFMVVALWETVRSFLFIKRWNPCCKVLWSIDIYIYVLYELITHNTTGHFVLHAVYMWVHGHWGRTQSLMWDMSENSFLLEISQGTYTEYWSNHLWFFFDISMVCSNFCVKL